jgi:hypothetical protein
MTSLRTYKRLHSAIARDVFTTFIVMTSYAHEFMQQSRSQGMQDELQRFALEL